MNRALRLLVVLVLLLLFGALPASAGRLSAPAATYLVTNTNNSGPNSLRQAIINANGNPGKDTITFDLAGANQSIRTISINTVLPAITDPVVIDGSTQPDYFGDPLIQLRWTGGDNTGTIGLHITAGDSTVDSLTISRFEDGIRLETGGDNVIVGNFIGTNGLGTAAEGNEYGIHVLDSPRNFIGGTGNDAPNLISGNDEDGIFIEGAASVDTIIQGNYIGTDDDGTAAIPNDFSGIVIEDAAGTLIGGGANDARNVISGNAFDGVLISFDSSGTLVRGNLIGTDRTGEANLGNGRYGVRVLASTGNSIGGNTVARRNVISGNGNAGVAIDGDENEVQGNFIGTDVDGTTALTNGGYGVEITGALSNTIGGPGAGEGNVISRNGSGGIRIFGGFTGPASNNRILGNRIGTNAAGLNALPNTGPGVFIESASGNFVGGTEAGAGNVISGNTAGGARIQGGSENQILGNLIGTDSTGNGALSNVGVGVTVDSSSGNVIGGPDASGRNVISANSGDGVLLTNVAAQNLVQSNYIGLGLDGATDLGNGSFGLHIVDSSANTIGGTTAGAGNTISGNAREGVLIEQAGATGNLVQGNRIGTNAAGTAAVPNLSAGVSIANSATDNTIGGDVDGAGNLISGNASNGVHLFFGANDNRVQGNRIGTNFNGAAALENMGVGVLVDDVSGTRIGGPSAAGNLISGNTNSGIRITDPGASETVVEGNTIGTDAATTTALPNGLYGIHVTAAPTNTIGGPADGAGNLISGNTQEGVLIELDGATGNVVQGNRIGTDGSGTAAVPNGAGGVTVANAATDTLIGGTEPGAGNLISGNKFNGILLFTTTENTVQGNRIGTDAAGTADLGNNVGVHLDGASDNLIGGIEDAARNLISGNNNYGVYISDASMNNNVMGNYIGTDAAGLTTISNNWDGVNIAGLSEGNVIGGAEAGAGNLISGNGSAGVEILFGSDDNQVLGNRIGTNATGATLLPNAAEGIYVNSADNTIGGTTAGAGNLISGNGSGGIYFGGGAETNTVQGNIIGTDRTGSLAMPNVTGIHIFDSPGNTIGGIEAGAGNLISGNDEFGIFITGQNAAQNLVQGNRIGTDATGVEAVANGLDGVQVQSAGPNMIGGTDAGAGNLIAFNTGNGVSIVAAGQVSSRKAILGNSIHSNGGLGIDLEWDGVTPNDEDDPDTGGNMLQNYPVLGPASSDGSNVTITGTLNSTASTTFRLEFFSNPACDPSGFGEGQTFLGADSVTTDINGDATFEVMLPDVVPSGSDNVTATATDPENNTSEFSQCVDVALVEPTAVQLRGLTSSPALPLIPIGAALGLLVTLGAGLVLRRRQRDS
jgi:hypothetical protein